MNHPYRPYIQGDPSSVILKQFVLPRKFLGLSVRCASNIAHYLSYIYFVLVLKVMN